MKSLRVLIIVGLILGQCPPWSWAMVKKPNVAGSFYSADPAYLRTQLQAFQQASTVSPEANIAMLIVPHAGYMYSGQIAADAYKKASAGQYSTVVVISPSHFFPFHAAALIPQGVMRTPLGDIEIDDTMTKALLERSNVFENNPAVFEKEHALEVQLPFIQQTLGEHVKVVPMIVGQVTVDTALNIAQSLVDVIGDRRDVLVVLSSDMSHYYPYQEANQMDQETIDLVVSGDIERFWEGNISRKVEMCGFIPVAIGMLMAKIKGLAPATLIRYANSGDTAGDKSKVVGYGAFAYQAKGLTAVLNESQQEELLHIARQSMEQWVRHRTKMAVSTQDVMLEQPQGAFVTLKINGQLRGCIGHVVSSQSLIETVRDMAIAASIEDPRFPPVKVDELSSIDVEVSVLSIPRQVSGAEEIVLGRDGVIVTDGQMHQGLFLPQVATETGWSKEEFLAQLCHQKAGLPSTCWKDNRYRLLTFTAQVFEERS